VRRSSLGEGAEFDLIRDLLSTAAGEDVAEIVLGPGDDAAVFRVSDDEQVVVSTDLAVEDVHFRRAWMRWEVVGYRAATAALSDLAAMAARPLGLLLSMALPPELAGEVAGSLASGVGRCLRMHGGALAGGDLSRSPGPVVLDVVAVGGARAPVERGGARPGDEVWVTGRLGGAAAAAADWLRGLEPDPRARRAFEQPVPRLGEARWLTAEARVTAMVDVSDGVAGDAGHLAAASGAGLELRLNRLPLAEVLDEYADRATALRRAATGGEDFELLFTAERDSVDRRAFERRFDVRLTRIGEVGGEQGVRWRDAAGDPVELGGAWDHFVGERVEDSTPSDASGSGTTDSP
jgi:thiamine-monophosphate kinase